MKEYYLNRFKWIFRYTSKNFWYCIGKTLCIIVGLPIYCICFAVEMILTAINMLFSWIPGFNIIIGILCKILIILFGSLFYICVLTDIKSYRDFLPEEPISENETSVEPIVDFEPADTDRKQTSAENTTSADSDGESSTN